MFYSIRLVGMSGLIFAVQVRHSRMSGSGMSGSGGGAEVGVQGGAWGVGVKGGVQGGVGGGAQGAAMLFLIVLTCLWA